MTKNVGTTDRIVRLVLAAVFIILFFTGMVAGTTGYILLALGVIFAATSFMSFCPIYYVSKLSTRK